MVDLVIRQRTATAETATAEGALSEVLGTARLRAIGEFRYEQRSLVDDGITFTRLACSADAVEVTSEGSADLLLVTVRDGQVQLSCRDTTSTQASDDVALIPFNEPCTLRFASATLDLFSFPLSAFVRTLGASGTSLTIQAPYLSSRSDDLTALWRRLADLLARHVLDRPDVYSNDVVRAQLIDALTAVTVEAFGLTNQEEDEHLRDQEVIRRADAFIRANLDQPITVPDIAAAAGISIRGLQLVCQRRLERTPIAHLRRARIYAARVALQNPAADTTVGGVGRRFGYSNLGRFSAHYRDEFGETPSRTLERGRPSR